MPVNAKLSPVHVRYVSDTCAVCVKGNSFSKSYIKSEDLSSNFTFYPLVTGPVQSCAISTPRGAYSPVAISVHWTYRTHCHLCPSRYSFSPEWNKAFEGEVSGPRTHHLNNVSRLRGEKHHISVKILHQSGFKNARQAATSAERNALTIAPCPFLSGMCTVCAQ